MRPRQETPRADEPRPLRPLSLAVPGITGFVGAVFVLVGVVQPGSPFVLKAPGAWFFATSATASSAGSGGNGTLLGIMLVYAGVAVMIGSWFEVVRTLRRHPGAALRSVVPIAIAWATPVVAMPPLFSRDVYSYAAQGEMVARGYSPYSSGPNVLGPGPFLGLVDPLWRSARAAYGPAWERLSGGLVQLAHHDVLAAVTAFRGVALLGVVLMAWGIPVLAQSAGRDRATAFALAVLNPLVLLVLLGGAHNDALMLGLLVVACVMARRNHFMAGLVLCVLASEVKIPALIGAALVGWWWCETAASRHQRLLRFLMAFVAVAGSVALVSAASGFGWRWLDGLSDPGVVVSWLDPTSAIGLALSHLSGLLGYGRHSGAFVEFARAIGLAGAAALSVGWIRRSDRIGQTQALGWSLIVFVVLGPVIWPWYETWGFVFVAVMAEGWVLLVVMALSGVACYADVPPARIFGMADPILEGICWAGLLTAVSAYAAVRLLPSLGRSLDGLNVQRSP